MRIDIKRGLNIRVDGAPSQRIDGSLAASRVALQTADYPGLKPGLLVGVGDPVRAGDPLLHDRRNEAVRFVSFVSGRVVEIRRGAKRRILEVVVAREGSNSRPFRSFDSRSLNKIGADELRETLLRSGLWTALRARPFDRIASPDIQPRALFITAIDTRPLSPDPAVVLAGDHEHFVTGVKALARLTSGKTYVCVAPGTAIPVPECQRVVRVEFRGPHPAGLPGTHVHAAGLAVTRDADLWHASYQDVTAIGRLLISGELSPRRVIAIAGPGARHPRLVRAIPGTGLNEFNDELQGSVGRIFAGSPLDDTGSLRYLGRYHNQVTLLPETTAARLIKPAGLFLKAMSECAAAYVPNAKSGMLPLEGFERIWPFRASPQPLLRALLAGDIDGAERYGCLGLAEEDLALCNYFCPGRNDYSAALRQTLDAIEQSA